MKVAVTYGSRTYGNSSPSRSSSIYVTGGRKCYIKIDFKGSQAGRSWDWQSCGLVDGAEIELDMKDAKALAALLLEYSELSEEHDPMEYDVVGRLLIREGHAPKTKVTVKPFGR